MHKQCMERMLKASGHDLKAIASVLEIPLSQLRQRMTELEIQ